MPNDFKTFTLGTLAAIFIVACQTPSAALAQNSFIPKDTKRNVLSFADALEPVLPSVVRIGRLDENADGKLVLSGLGSGAVIDAKNGYVITNAHVVNKGKGFLINIPDGRVVEARLVGMDTPTDIAVLQADDLRVDAVTKANSDQLRIGDVVFAVGYPLGLEQSLSFGVVSGLGRTSSRTGLQDFIQTDAAINSGNSGGPLLDSQGRLVGVNTAIVSRSGGNNGIGFSVPIDLATQVTDQLIKYGEVRRGSIGVESTQVSEEASEVVGIDHWDGAYVTKIRAGSAAESAGLQVGDVISSFDGKKVKTPSALRAWIGVAETNSTHKLSYIRKNGVETTVNIMVNSTKSSIVQGLEELGAFIRPTQAKDNLPEHVKGVYVSRVTKDSPAERSGLMVGDVISKVNNEEAETMKDSNRLVRQSKGRARLLVYRFGVAVPIIIEP